MTNLPQVILNRISKKLHIWSGVGRGWWPLLEEMDKELANLYSDYSIAQVKEKFGILRVYADNIDDRGQDIVNNYEHKSATTCEVCEIGRAHV